MKRHCEYCNYTTTRKSSYDKHVETDKHFKNVKLYEDKMKKLQMKAHLCSNDTPNIAKPQSSITQVGGFCYCIYCGNYYKYSKNLSRHLKNCKSKSNLLIKYNKLLEEVDMLRSDKEKLEVRCNELHHKYDESRDNLLTAKDDLISSLKTYKPTPGLFSFVKGNHHKTKPLQEIKTRDVPELSFLKPILDTKDGELELCEIVQHHILHCTFDGFVGNYLVDEYQETDKTKQKFFNTDFSRLTYLVRDLVNNVPTWRKDNKGVIVSAKIIDPILEYMRKHLTKHSQKYLKMSMKKYSHSEFIERNHRLLKVIKHIDDGSLSKKILKYIAPFFRHEVDSNIDVSNAVNINDKGKKNLKYNKKKKKA